jgi:hypothetical protein
MTEFESILGDQSESPQKNKPNNVAEFNSPSSKKETTAPAGGDSLRTDTIDGAATARRLYDQAKETAGQAYEVVTDKAATKLDEQKSTLSGGLNTVADSVRQVGENLGSSKTESGLTGTAAKYTNTAAKRIEDLAGYFETHSVRDMAQDLEGFARRNPAVFFGAAFGLGLLAARFLKSTPPRHNTARAGGDFAAAPDTGHELQAGSGQQSRSTDFTARPF